MMNEPAQIPSPRRPFWVKLILLGASSRAAAMACVWLCSAFAVVAVAISFWKPHFVAAAILFFLGAVAYLRAIAWNDRNQAW